MQFFILGIVVIVLVLLGLKSFANMEPKKLVKLVKRFGGILAIAIGGFMTMRGLAIIGFPVMAAGLSMLSGGFGLSGLWANRTQKAQGQQSRVRSSSLEMELDHDTGAMDGMVLRGAFKGARLSKMSPDELRHLHGEVASSGDNQALALLEAYLQRMHPEWFEAQEGGARNSSVGTGDQAMTKDQALEILGLEPGASQADIKSAHRTLMQKLHPDHGGSTYLASKINEAKDFLLGK
jgi:DnaJ domain